MKSFNRNSPALELEVDLNSMGDIRFTANFGLVFCIHAMDLLDISRQSNLDRVRFELENPAKKYWKMLEARHRLLVMNYNSYGEGVGKLRAFWPGSETVKFNVNPQGALTIESGRMIQLREEIRSGFVPVTVRGLYGQHEDFLTQWAEIYLDEPFSGEVAPMLIKAVNDLIDWLPTSGFSFMVHSITPSPLPYYFSPKPEGRKSFKNALTQFNISSTT